MREKCREDERISNGRSGKLKAEKLLCEEKAAKATREIAFFSNDNSRRHGEMTRHIEVETQAKDDDDDVGSG